MALGNFAPFARKMEKAGIKAAAVSSFRRHYSELLRGEAGYLPGSAIAPISHLPKLEELPECDDSLYASRIAILKLNGGLGTSMGLRGPKSLLMVREGYNFLEILLKQIKACRSRHHACVPLVLLNSFNTSFQTEQFVGSHPEIISQPIEHELLQSQVPKILAETLAPARFPKNPVLEWCPPGHGDVFLSLYQSGMLKKMLNLGLRWLFLSNIDNLGAVLDMRIPAYMEMSGAPVLMEAALRCPVDRKGGHLALKRGQLILREAAMCPPGEKEDFQNIDKYRYFNTNSLWIDIRALAEKAEKCGGDLPLPLIVNRKTLDPSDQYSPKVYQLETAMGAVISLFRNSCALEVPRTRFAPVKTLSDLAALRSNAYRLSDDWQVCLNGRAAPPEIVLAPEHFRDVRSLDRSFPYGMPDLSECHSLAVDSPAVFGRGVKCAGDVRVSELAIPDGAVIKG